MTQQVPSEFQRVLESEGEGGASPDGQLQSGACPHAPTKYLNPPGMHSVTPLSKEVRGTRDWVGRQWGKV